MSRESNKKARKARNKARKSQLFDGTHVRGDMRDNNSLQSHFLGTFRGGTTLELVGCGVRVPTADLDGAEPNRLLVERTKLAVSVSNTDVSDKSSWN